MTVIKILCTYLLLLFGLVACSPREDSLRTLGTVPFTSEQWRVATQEERAKMLHSFVKTHDIERLTAKDIFNLLGPSTSYYQYDDFPAYLVGPKTVQSQAGQGYLLAFPVNRSTDLIQEFVLDPMPNSLVTR